MGKSISIEGISEVFSANSGLILLEKLWRELKVEKYLKRFLPKKKRNKGPDQVNKVKSLLYSFAVGNDCLDDLDTLFNDELYRELSAGGCSAKCMGDFLRSFSKHHIVKFQDFLIDFAMKLRLMLSNEKEFILSMDSTYHEHRAFKMEGISENYKGKWCLDSQNAYDQFGLSYLFDLRPGQVHSGKDSELWIHKIFSKVPGHFNRWFRADSAYSKHSVFEALQIKKVNFAIVLKENIAKYVRKKNIHFLSWRKTELNFFNSTNCEVATGLYPVKKAGILRVIFIRVRRDNPQLDLIDENYNELAYRHYSIVTNTSGYDFSEEELIEFYRGRANCENYIRDQKYGYDFLNFPCKKLTANTIFGIIGTMTHNLMRYLSFQMNKKTKRVRTKKNRIVTVIQNNYFTKTVRKSLIHIPCRLVRSARKLKVRVEHYNKEVLDKVLWKIEKNISEQSYGIQPKT